MQDKTWIIWLALLVGSLVMEGIALQLFSIWFAAGALAAVLSCAFGAQPWLQMAIFAGVTAIGLLVSKPIVQRLQNKRGPGAG